MFSGALRSGEVLPYKVASFVRDSTLMPTDIEVVTETLHGEAITFLKLRVKLPKEGKGQKFTWVELFEVNKIKMINRCDIK